MHRLKYLLTLLLTPECDRFGIDQSEYQENLEQQLYNIRLIECIQSRLT